MYRCLKLIALDLENTLSTFGGNGGAIFIFTQAEIGDGTPEARTLEVRIPGKG